MPAPGMNEVANELLRLSRDKKLNWKKARRDNEYMVSFPEMSFSISFERVGKTYKLDMIDETGLVTDSLRSKPLDSDTASLSDLPELIELYNLAFSYIRKVNIEKALDYLRSR